ncbi:MAG TPA: endolytic transglycosylase MltG [Egibacteraceae bacterium]|nr:endolytic transglycosylase MltG [Egibacteraceae bacterium]
MALSKGSKAFLAVVAAGVLLISGYLVASSSVAAPQEVAEGPVQIEVPEGATADQVGQLLADAGLIRSTLAFKLLAQVDGRASQIRAGSYEIQPGMDAEQILAVLSQGPPEAETYKVAIPEGLTVEQTLERLAAAEGSGLTLEELREALSAIALPAWVPLDTLPEGAEPFEGLLFPATYDFVVGADPQQVLARLVEQTETVMTEITPAPGMDRYQTLIVASLIEREARIRDEQPVISAVIHNRLELPMRLQIDATVLYALGGHKDRVTFEDLEVDSPWNTYAVDGLPPTPISGAGRSAIDAAAAPADAEYLYYVVINPETGEHGFSTTLEEHNQLKAEAQAAG